MEEETLFVAEKSAYQPRVVFMVLLFCPVSWQTNPNISRLAEEMASDGIRPDRAPFGFGSALGAFLKYLYSAILRTGSMNYVHIQIAWWWNNFRWKLILQMMANSRNPWNIQHYIAHVVEVSQLVEPYWRDLLYQLFDKKCCQRFDQCSGHRQGKSELCGSIGGFCSLHVWATVMGA